MVQDPLHSAQNKGNNHRKQDQSKVVQDHLHSTQVAGSHKMEDQFRIQNNVKVNQYQQKQERYLAFIGAMYINMKGTDVYNGQNIDMVKKEKNLRILGTTRNILQEQHMKAGDTALIKDRVRSNVNIKKNKAIIKFTNIYTRTYIKQNRTRHIKYEYEEKHV